MKFLKKFTVHQNVIPSYGDFNAEWTESIPKNLALCLLNCEDINQISRTNFQKTFELIQNDEIKVKYEQRRKCGRFYPFSPESQFIEINGVDRPVNGFGKYYGNLTIHNKLIKNTIFHHLGCIDVDQVKGHPTILHDVALNNGIILKSYKMYIDNFDEIVTDFITHYGAIDKNDVKMLFNSTIYGGSYQTWENEMTLNLSQPEIDKRIGWGQVKKEIRLDYPHPLWCQFETETKMITKVIYDANPSLVALLCNDLPDDSLDSYSKRRNRVMSYFCQIIENDLTYSAYKYCVQYGLCEKKKVSWGYDGFTMPPSTADYKFHMNALNLDIRSKSGLKNITFIIKPFSNVLHAVIQQFVSMPIANPTEVVEAVASQDIFVNDDKEACDYMLHLLEHQIVKCDGRLFYKNGNIWINDVQEINEIILVKITNTPLYKQGKEVSSFSQNVKNAKNIRELLFANIINSPNFIKQIHKSTKYRICFLDGVLDFKLRKFFKWDDVEIYTTTIINRNFADYFLNPNPSIIGEVKKNFFETLFKCDVDNSLLFFARAIAGCIEDKNLMFYFSNRDSGKSLFQKLLNNAFESYISPFELNNLLVLKNSSELSDSRKLYWLVPLEFKRVAVSQETPPPEKGLVISSKLVKSVMSAGDTIIARENYGRKDTAFSTDATLCSFGNYSLMADSPDVFEHVFQCNSVFQYKFQNEYDDLKKVKSELEMKRYKVKDLSLEDKLDTDEYMNAFVMLLFNSFKDCAVKIEVDEDEVISILGVIQNEYVFTYNVDDVVLCSDLFELVGDKKKLVAELLSVNIIKKQHNKKDALRNKQVFVGIKLIENEIVNDIIIEE